MREGRPPAEYLLSLADLDLLWGPLSFCRWGARSVCLPCASFSRHARYDHSLRRPAQERRNGASADHGVLSVAMSRKCGISDGGSRSHLSLPSQHTRSPFSPTLPLFTLPAHTLSPFLAQTRSPFSLFTLSPHSPQTHTLLPPRTMRHW